MTYHPISQIEVRTIRLPKEEVVDSKKVALEGVYQAADLPRGTSQSAHLSILAFLFGSSGIALFADANGSPTGKTIALVTWNGEIRELKALRCPNVQYRYYELENPRRYEVELVHQEGYNSYIGRWPECPRTMTIDASLKLVGK
jgi:hypothetical protein